VRIAIVIPVFYANGQHLQAIRSAVEQTVQPDKVICVVNGRSPAEQDAIFDGIRDLWASLKHDPAQCKLLGSYKGNVSAARNIGFHVASETCTHVVPLDEDDLLLPAYIERMQQAHVLLPDRGVLYPDWVWFDGKVGYGHHREYNFETMTQEPYIICTSLISVEAWRKVRKYNGMGFDEKLVDRSMRWEDYLFFLTAAALGVKMSRVGQALVQVRAGGEGTKIAHRTMRQWIAYANRVLSRLGVRLNDRSSTPE